MVSRVFCARVRQSPLGIEGLAHRVGMGRFWLSRLLSYADAVEARDPKIGKIGWLVGLRPEEVFEGGDQP